MELRCIFCEIRGNTQIAEENRSVVIDQKICSLNVAVDESINMEITKKEIFEDE